MDIAYAWTCMTNEDFGPIDVPSSNGKDTYHVSWGRTPFGDTQYGPHCTCKGFKFHSKCPHIEIMETQRCGWNACLEPCATSEYDTDGSPVCPDCAGPVRSYRVAV